MSFGSWGPRSGLRVLANEGPWSPGGRPTSPSCSLREGPARHYLIPEKKKKKKKNRPARAPATPDRCEKKKKKKTRSLTKRSVDSLSGGARGSRGRAAGALPPRRGAWLRGGRGQGWWGLRVSGQRRGGGGAVAGGGGRAAARAGAGAGSPAPAIPPFFVSLVLLFPNIRSFVSFFLSSFFFLSFFYSGVRAGGDRKRDRR